MKLEDLRKMLETDGDAEVCSKGEIEARSYFMIPSWKTTAEERAEEIRKAATCPHCGNMRPVFRSYAENTFEIMSCEACSK